MIIDPKTRNSKYQKIHGKMNGKKKRKSKLRQRKGSERSKNSGGDKCEEDDSM